MINVTKEGCRVAWDRVCRGSAFLRGLRRETAKRWEGAPVACFSLWGHLILLSDALVDSFVTLCSSVTSPEFMVLCVIICPFPQKFHLLFNSADTDFHLPFFVFREHFLPYFVLSLTNLSIYSPLGTRVIHLLAVLCPPCLIFSRNHLPLFVLCRVTFCDLLCVLSSSLCHCVFASSTAFTFSALVSFFLLVFSFTNLLFTSFGALSLFLVFCISSLGSWCQSLCCPSFLGENRG